MAALVRKRRRTLGSYKGNWFVSDCKNIRGREGERERGKEGKREVALSQTVTRRSVVTNGGW